MDQLHVLTSELSFGLFSTLGNCLQIFESLAQDPDPLLDPHREKQLDPDQQKWIQIHSPALISVQYFNYSNKNF